MITLRSRKVYVGFIAKRIKIQDKTDFLVIWPQLAGHRDRETLKVNITYNYVEIYQEIDENPDKFPNFAIDDSEIVIPVSEIESVSVFDPDVFLTQSEDDEENLENDEAKLLGSQAGKPVTFADEKERVKEKE
jgi:hypothetical protein